MITPAGQIASPSHVASASPIASSGHIAGPAISRVPAISRSPAIWGPPLVPGNIGATRASLCIRTTRQVAGRTRRASCDERHATSAMRRASCDERLATDATRLTSPRRPLPRLLSPRPRTHDSPRLPSLRSCPCGSCPWTPVSDSAPRFPSPRLPCLASPANQRYCQLIEAPFTGPGHGLLREQPPVGLFDPLIVMCTPRPLLEVSWR